MIGRFNPYITTLYLIDKIDTNNILVTYGIDEEKNKKSTYIKLWKVNELNLKSEINCKFSFIALKYIIFVYLQNHPNLF